MVLVDGLFCHLWVVVTVRHLIGIPMLVLHQFGALGTLGCQRVSSSGQVGAFSAACGSSFPPPFGRRDAWCPLPFSIISLAAGFMCGTILVIVLDALLAIPVLIVGIPFLVQQSGEPP